MIDTHFDTVRGRLTVRYHGFWTLDDGRRAHDAFRAAIIDASGHRQPFTLLDDASDWPVQSAETVAFNQHFTATCQTAPILRNAMVIPSILLRRQIQRTLDGLENCVLFGTMEEADAWLSDVEPQVPSDADTA